MKKLRLDKKIIILIVALVLVAALVAGEVFAWFSMNTQNKAGNFGVGVPGLGEDGGQINVSINGSGSEDEVLFLPGDTLELDISLTNTTNLDLDYNIVISSLTITYPTATVGFNYSDSMVYNDGYVRGTDGVTFGDDYTDTVLAMNATDSQAFFRQFIEPYANAIQYKCYLSSGTEPEDYLELVETKTKHNSATDLASTGGVSVLSNSLIKSGNQTLTVSVQSSATVNLILKLYYNPAYYSVINDGQTPIVYYYKMLNSNPFSSQHMLMMVDFSVVE